MVRQEMPIEAFGVDVRVTQRASVDSKRPQDGPPTALAGHLGTSLHMRFFGPMRRGVVLVIVAALRPGRTILAPASFTIGKVQHRTDGALEALAKGPLGDRGAACGD